MTKETPLRLEGVHDNIYAGFGPRLASLLLDAIILLPVIWLFLYLNSTSKEMYFYTIVPNMAISLFYYVYLPKKYGATPGKLIMGLKIIRLDGHEIGIKEAFLRHLVIFILTLFSIGLTSYCISKADNATFQNISWLQQSQYLMSFSPILFTVYAWTSQVWSWSELIVLLMNDRKRALHDYIAGTVIIQKIYFERIQEVMHSENENNE